VVGSRFTTTTGNIAHGGHVVARLGEPESRVVFVRHALPGERVEIEITEGTEGDRFWRADAVEVLEASPDRVTPPCPFAGPGRCGGCDFQHVALPAQRALKAAVVREQLVRLGGLPPDHPLVSGLVVEPVPGDADGLRWRTRVVYAVAPDGSRGMRRHRSRTVIPVDDCRIAAPDAVVRIARGPDAGTVEPDAAGGAADVTRVERVAAAGETREFAVAGDGFWQVHPGAPAVLVETVLELLAPQRGERALDLYAGAGLFAAYLAGRVGESGRVVAVEGSRVAAGHARENLASFGQARVEAGRVDRVLAASYDEPFDLVVLDPPREGARRTVVDQVADRAPRAVAYVACDPAALARDVAFFAGHGYRLTGLRALDLFPMTHHVECVALLTR
jgi:tRNA/tmRNA/rRNA uracil-C5-methylase (TrmA/RlmC/RlmD family)